jgi:secreted protein, putative (fragment)
MPRLNLIENFAFSDLHKLKRLEITYNPILAYIDNEAFLDIDVNLTRFPIEILLLNNNDLKTLSEYTLPWCKIPKVDLRDNDWNCNCELKWIKECEDNEDFKSVK